MGVGQWPVPLPLFFLFKSVRWIKCRVTTSTLGWIVFSQFLHGDSAALISVQIVPIISHIISHIVSHIVSQ